MNLQKQTFAQKKVAEIIEKIREALQNGENLHREHLLTCAYIAEMKNNEIPFTGLFRLFYHQEIKDLRTFAIDALQFCRKNYR